MFKSGILALSLFLLQAAPQGPGFVTGTVHSSNGDPAPRVRVYAITYRDAVEAGKLPPALESLTETDASGKYRLELQPGRYVVVTGSVAAPTYYPGTPDIAAAKVITVARDLSVPDIDFGTFVPASRATVGGNPPIRATATIAGTPAAGVELTLARPQVQAVQPPLPEALETIRGYLESIAPPAGGVPRVVSSVRMTPLAATQALARDITVVPAGPIYNAGGAVGYPQPVQQVLPTYSDEARRLRLQGAVELMIVVRDDGSVGGAQILRGPGVGLDEKAVEAVKQWKFAPAMRDGKAVAVYVTVSVSFTLAASTPLPKAIGMTDNAGEGVLSNLPSGRFVVVGKRDGLIGIAPAVVPLPNQVVALRLQPAATLRGKVRDSSGAPVSGAQVNLGLTSDQQGRRVFIEGASMLTDSSGEFSFASLVPGTFYLRVQPPTSSEIVYYPASRDFDQATAVPVEAGKEVVGIDITVPRVN